MIVRILWIQVWNMNKAILAVVAPAQMGTNSVLRGFHIRVIAVIEDHELDVAKDVFDRVIVGTAFGQADPMQLQITHHLTGHVRFTGMSAVLVKRNPNRVIRIPRPKAMHKLTDIFGAFAGQEHPMHLSTDGIIAHEQIKVSACFLVTQKHQTFRRSVTPPTVGFDCNGFDIEEQETPTGGQMPKNPAQASQNCRSLRVLAEQFALHPPEVQTVFLATDATVRAQ